MLYPSSHDRREALFSLGGSSVGVECFLGGDIVRRSISSGDEALLDKSVRSVGSIVMSLCPGTLKTFRE